MVKINYQTEIKNFLNSTKEYIDSKLLKINNLVSDEAYLTIKISEEGKGKNKFKMELNLKLPNVYIKVSSKGDNINKLIDSLIDPLFKKIKRYNSQKERWADHKNWKNEQIEESSETNDSEVVQLYIPKIKRKYYEDDTPIHPSEAIERMELLGHNSYLFKNIENNKYGMIIKDDNIYTLVQPQ